MILHAPQCFQLFLCRNVQCGQLVAGAVQRLQLCQCAQFQHSQLIALARQFRQFRQFGEFQRRQLVRCTAEFLQQCIGRAIQRGQLVIVAVQLFQLPQRPQGNCRQLIIGAVQRLQCCKVFHAGQVGDLVDRNVQFCDLFQFRPGKQSVTVGVIPDNDTAEIFVRKILCINGHTRFLCCLRHQCKCDYTVRIICLHLILI